MSGWHPDLEVYELTASQAGRWFRRPLDGPLADLQHGELGGIPLVAEVLRRAGYEVPLVQSGWLMTAATGGQVWEALSGLPADPGRPERVPSHAGTQVAAGWDAYYSVSHLGLCCDPRRSAVAVNKALAAAGFQRRANDGRWEPTPAGRPQAQPVQHGHGRIPPGGGRREPGTVWYWKRGVLRELPDVAARPLPLASAPTP